jgi:hypothetical protein
MTKSQMGKESQTTNVGWEMKKWRLEQPLWQVVDTIPNFIRTQGNLFLFDRYPPRKSIWIPAPTNFHELIQIYRDLAKCIKKVGTLRLA